MTQNTQNDANPARGIAYGLLISIPIWAMIIISIAYIVKG